MTFSIITPLDPDRLDLYANSKRAYDALGHPDVEYVVVTRHPDDVISYLVENELHKGVHVVAYSLETPGFNCSRALNLGVQTAQFDNIIITSPEVMPTSPVFELLEARAGKNVVCQVFDEYPDGSRSVSLVNSSYRCATPSMYFLAMFQKSDILRINGWDENFLLGYAYEDDDFGARWVRAGIPFEVADEITAVHQWHPRNETIPGGYEANHQRFLMNNVNSIIRCANGIQKLGRI